MLFVNAPVLALVFHPTVTCNAALTALLESLHARVVAKGAGFGYVGRQLFIDSKSRNK